MNSIRENWFNNIPITGEQAEECGRIARSIDDLARMYLDKKIQCNQTFKLNWGRVELDVDSKCAYVRLIPNQVNGMTHEINFSIFLFPENRRWSCGMDLFDDGALKTGFCCMQKIVNAYTWIHSSIAEFMLYRANPWGKPVKEAAK